MFCPKCGTRSENGRFCRSCGTNLVRVSSVISEATPARPYLQRRGATLGLFSSAALSNETCELDGHIAASIFGSVTVDLTAAALPPGETRLSLYSLFGAANVLVPDDVAVRVSGLWLFSSFKVRGQQVGNEMFSLDEYVAPGYAQAARRLHISAASVFGGVKIVKRG